MNTPSICSPNASLRLPGLVLGLLLVFGTHFNLAYAFKLSPMKMTLSPQGRGASGVFTVSNDSDETLAVDVHFLSRSLSPDGKEINERADKQFMVFPPQFALAPGKKQTVRVKWIGKKPVVEELAFRLVAEQLPIRLTKGSDGGVNLNVAIRYLAAVYVSPKGAKEDLVIKAEKVSTDSQNGLLLDLSNQGSRHVILRDLTVELSCRGETVQIPADQLTSIDGENLLAGSSRRVRLPWPQSLPVGVPVARIDYRK